MLHGLCSQLQYKIQLPILHNVFLIQIYYTINTLPYKIRTSPHHTSIINLLLKHITTNARSQPRTRRTSLTRALANPPPPHFALKPCHACLNFFHCTSILLQINRLQHELPKGIRIALTASTPSFLHTFRSASHFSTPILFALATRMLILHIREPSSAPVPLQIRA